MRTHAIQVLAFMAVAAQEPSTRRAEPPARSPQHVVPIIVPAASAERVGGSNSIPFGWQTNGPIRYQQFFTPEKFEFEGSLLLSGAAFRLGAGGTTGVDASIEIDVEITLSTAPAGTLSAKFEKNLAGPRVVVLPRRKTLVRASPARQDSDQDPLKIWDLEIPFERTFQYRTDRVLVMDVKIFGFSNSDFRFTADYQTDPSGISRAWGGISDAQGKTDGHALVVRFDVAARAAKSSSAPASRPQR